MLGQRLRRWPTLNQHLVTVLCAGKALTVNMREGLLSLDPHGNTTIYLSTQSPHERIGELFSDRCRSVY